VVFFALCSSLFALVATSVPVVRTPEKMLEEIAQLIDAKKGQTIVDAGCGDARALLAFCAGRGARGRGYELNGPLKLFAVFRVLFAGQRKSIKIYFGNFFRCELEDVDLVYCFLMPGVMRRVGNKCLEEMRPGSRLVSYLWEVPDWEPTETIYLGARQDPLFIYVLPAEAKKDTDLAC
jgi:SAM-dependent methyltransferase